MNEPEPAPPPGADMLGFVTDQMAFVGLGDEDMALIQRTAPLVLAHEAALTSALYDHLLKFPATARFFVNEDGSPDRERIERRKHSLARWLRESAEINAAREGASYYVLSGHTRAATGAGEPAARFPRRSWSAP